MKNVSFLVAILAFLQIASGSPIYAQDRVTDDARRSVEEALDRAGEDIADELEELIQQLEKSAQKMGQQLERWAEENSQELEAWSEKYAEEWEAWGERFSRKMERMSAEQEDVWGNWAQRYEKDLERWADELESNELAPQHIGEFVEKNLKTLSRMPLGQMVDQALDDGLGQLSEAPWESLEELGELAKDAFEEPLSELSEILDENSPQRRALEKSARGVQRALEEFDDSVSSTFSDTRERPQVRDTVQPRLQALERLLEREDLSAQQRERVKTLIKTMQDASRLQKDRGADRAVDSRPRIDVPRGDQLKQKLEQEKRRRVEELERSDRDTKRTKDELRKEILRKSNQKSQKLDSRLPKRPDGKNADGSLKKPTNARQGSQRFQRDGRDGKANRKPAVDSIRSTNVPRAQEFGFL